MKQITKVMSYGVPSRYDRPNTPEGREGKRREALQKRKDGKKDRNGNPLPPLHFPDYSQYEGGRQLLLKQMELAVVYRDRLADVELFRRKEADRIARDHNPELRKVLNSISLLNGRVEEKRDEIKRQNQKVRKRTATDDTKDDLRPLFDALKNLYEERSRLLKPMFDWPGEVTALMNKEKDRRKELGVGKVVKCRTHPIIGPLIAEVDEAKRKFMEEYPFRKELYTMEKLCQLRSKELQRTSGLEWGTYQAVGEDAQKFRKGMPPRWRMKRAEKGEEINLPWNGEGRFAVHFQGGGIRVEDLLAGKDDRAHCFGRDPRHTQAGAKALYLQPTSGEIQRNAVVRLRVSIPTGDYRPTGLPVRETTYVEVPFVYHTPLPEDGVVSWVFITRRRTGTKYHWGVRFVVKSSQQQRADGGKVRVAFDWRVTVTKDLVVASWLGEDGRRGDLKLDHEKFLGRLEWADRLQEEKKKYLDEMTNALVYFRINEACPEWFREEIRSIGQNTRAARLVSLRRKWSGSRFNGDEKLYQRLLVWERGDGTKQNRGDKSLWDEMCFLRKAALEYRKWVYRNFAAELTGKTDRDPGYKTVLVPNTDLRRGGKKKKPEDTDEKGNALRRYQKMVSLSELRTYLKQAAVVCKGYEITPTRRGVVGKTPGGFRK